MSKILTKYSLGVRGAPFGNLCCKYLQHSCGIVNNRDESLEVAASSSNCRISEPHFPVFSYFGLQFEFKSKSLFVHSNPEISKRLSSDIYNTKGKRSNKVFM
jgi:hypothetical protein